MRVPYRYERGRILRPMLDVDVLSASGQVFSADALVDSGADTCLFDMSIAREATATLYPQLARRISGVSGRIDSIPGLLTIRILGHKLQLRTQFAENVEPNLLGRDDFFRYFHVCFDERASELELRFRRTSPH